MIKLDPKAEINAEVIFSNLMKRKHMVTRFRLPYTAKQVYAMLYEACRVEVAHRHREFNATEQYKSTFGTFPIGLHRKPPLSDCSFAAVPVMEKPPFYVRCKTL